jgi:membrane protein YdbS with pleckstrin-like domain
VTCPACGAGIEPDSRFCRHCGAAVAAAGRGPGTPVDASAAEHEVWAGRPSWRAGWWMWVAWAGLGLAGLIVVGRRWPEGSPVRTGLWLALAGAGVALAVRQVLIVLGQRYRLTNQRLFITRGILSRLTDQMELVRVDDVRLRQGFADRVAGTGDVEILGSDQTDHDVILESIDDPASVAEAVRSRVRDARGRGTLFVEHV